MKNLEKGKAKYEIRVLKAEKAGEGRNDVKALFDRDHSTFWCWRGKSATLLLRFQSELLIENETDERNLREVALLNGAARSRQTFEQFGLAKTLSSRPKDVPESDDESYRNKEKLPLPIMKGDNDLFRSHWLAGNLSITGFFEGTKGTPQTKKQIAEYRKNIKTREFVLNIEDVHKRKDSDESCISEIYPAYN